MIGEISFVILTVAVLVVILLLLSAGLILYKFFNNLKEKKEALLVDRYKNEILSILVGKSAEPKIFQNFDILTDVIYQYFGWIAGEEKEKLHRELEKIGYTEALIDAVKMTGEGSLKA